MNRQNLLDIISDHKTRIKVHEAFVEAAEDALRGLEEEEDWQCLYGPEHTDPINGRCGWCGENPKGD